MKETESRVPAMNLNESYERPQNRWRLKSQAPAAEIKALAQQLNGNELIASLLLQRGIRTFEEAKKF